MSEPKRSVSPQAKILALVGQDNQSLREDRDAWRKNARFWQYASLGLLVVVVLLATGIFKPETKVVAQVTDGKNSWVVPLSTLDRPHVHVGAVTSFASEAATAALSFSFAKWQQEIHVIDNYYLPDAAVQLKQALTSSRYFQRLEETASVTTVSPKTAPVIVASQSKPEVKWKLTFPVTITWRGPVTRTEEVSVEMVVTQVQPVVNPRGIMVERVNII